MDLSNTETTTSGIKAYYATAAGSGKLTLTETNYIPARTGTNHDEYNGVLIKVDKPGTTYYYQIGENDYNSSNPTAAPTKNLLVGVPADTYVEPTPSGYVNYGLSSGIFKKYSQSGFVSWNHAYLHLPIALAKSAKPFNLDESTTTGIVTPKATTLHDDAYYTLDGIRMEGKPSAPGIYIKDGKKVGIK